MKLFYALIEKVGKKILIQVSLISISITMPKEFELK